MQSSPSRALLGTINGANQALASLCRAIGPAVAGIMYSQGLEISKPWIVWRYGLGVFSIVVYLGGWFLTDEVCLPSPTTYLPLSDRDQDGVIAEEIQEEEDSTQRQGGNGTHILD